ncbi:MAG: RNA polymerase sigma factor [Armatimonadota bacterium]|nr:MAG: RNA polymerase sigma factor [Armatimonadota bacterium]
MGELASIWQNPLYYYVRRLARDEEDTLDIMQDTWVLVIRRFRQLRNPAAFPAWLFKIARNVAHSHTRKSRRQEIGAEDEPVPQRMQEESSDPLAEFTAEDVHRALGKLTMAHRDCLTLHFIEGFSLLEVSQIAGVPLGTVKSRLYHAKKCLRRALEEEVNRDE